MEKSNLLIAMAEQCRNMIQQAETTDAVLPASLQPKHLMWMCDKIEQHVEDWPVTKLHRWIGFVQGGMIANQLLDLAGAKAMFDEVKIAFGAKSDDPHLIDHLDPDHPFELDIGGEG